MTGGTGHLGRALVDTALSEGHVVRVLSRHGHAEGSPFEFVQGDLGSGLGVAEAVDGVDGILHAASDPADSEKVDVDGSARLADAARRAGVGHLVFVSIVGVDRIPFHYYRHKLAAEKAIQESGVPCSILRAAQFHYFVDYLLRQAAARLPMILPVPLGFRVRSIGTGDVARELCRIVASEPRGLLPDSVGPEAMSARVAARMWLRARRMRRVVVPIPVPGAAAAAFRAGHNTAPDAPSDGETWEEWLDDRYRAVP